MSAIHTVLTNPDLLGYICDFNTGNAVDFIKHNRLIGLKRRWKYLHRCKLFETACMYGRIDIVKWMHEKCNEDCTPGAMNWAAGKGHLDVVKWLYENRTEGCTTNAMDWAAQNEHLDVVKWLRSVKK